MQDRKRNVILQLGTGPRAGTAVRSELRSGTGPRLEAEDPRLMLQTEGVLRPDLYGLPWCLVLDDAVRDGAAAERARLGARVDPSLDWVVPFRQVAQSQGDGS
jgi:hypothetical protein